MSVMDETNRYRTFWPRVGAMFLDGAALAPLSWLDQLIWNAMAQPLVLVAWVFAYNIVVVAYMVGFVAKFGQTPGKMACGVKIVDVAGGPVSLGQAILREIVPLAAIAFDLFLQVQNILAGELASRAMGPVSVWLWSAWIMGGWMLLEVITMLTNDKRRAIHDFIAGTVVVRLPARIRLVQALIALLLMNLVVSWVWEDRNMQDGLRRAGPAFGNAVAVRLHAEAADDIVAR